MKTILFTLVLGLFVTGFFLSKPGSLESKSVNSATLDVCNDPTCGSAPVDFLHILLVNDDGTIESIPCNLTTGNCCTFTGLPAGNYHVEHWYDGGPVCSTKSFYLNEGEYQKISYCTCS